MTWVDSDETSRASDGGRYGGRRTLVVAASLAALVLGVTALLTAGAPRSHLSRLATAPEASAPSAASLAASRGVGSDQHAFWVARSPSGLLAVNRGQRMRATFSRGAVRVAVPAGAISMALRAAGRGDSLHSVTPADPVARGNGVSYARGGLVEWYANGPLGLEQGVTLPAAPAAGAGVSGDLRLSFALSGAAARLEGGQLVFSGTAGRPILRYSGLSATDAGGRLLPSSLQLAGDRLLIRINDRGARYPITIDPLIQAATLTASDAAQGSEFGFRTAVSGSTLVVGGAGATKGNAADANAGALYVFTEPASGWANATQVAKLTASATNPSLDLGESVGISGNAIYAVGNDTAMATIPADPGVVYVYAEPAGGWASANNTTETAVLSDTTLPSGFTQVAVSPSASGDTVFGGAPELGGPIAPGAVDVFKGPAGGWTASQSGEAPSAVLTPSDSGGALGSYLAVSGQTLVAGATYGGPVEQGAVYVFEGPWTTSGNQTAELTAPAGAGAQLGYKVATDGSTIVAGAPFQTDGSTGSAGAAYVYTEPASGWAGAASPMSPTAELTPSTPVDLGLFGLRIAVGQFPIGATSSSGPNSATTVETIFVGTGDGTGIYGFAEPASGWATASAAALMGLSSASTYSLTLDGGYLLEGADESTNENTVTPNYLPGQVNVFDAPSTTVGGGGPAGPPVNTGAPVVTGSPKAGGKLTCSTGTWTNSPTGFAYQWYRDGTPIQGATSSTYTVQKGDEELTLTCSVVASNAKGSASPAKSAKGAVVPVPKVKGCPAATGKLSGETLGLVRLGLTRAQARKRYTHSSNRHKKYQDFFCLTPIGVRVAYGSPALPKRIRGRVAGRVIWASTSSAYYAVDGVRVGATVAAAGARLKLTAAFHIGLNAWYLAPNGSSTAVLKTRRGIVEEIGIGDKALTKGHKAQLAFLKSFD
jgi:hypothetical protein